MNIIYMSEKISTMGHMLSISVRSKQYILGSMLYALGLYKRSSRLRMSDEISCRIANLHPFLLPHRLQSMFFVIEPSSTNLSIEVVSSLLKYIVNS
jgi:hypothetical protein